MITITLRRIMDCNPCYDPIERGIFEKDHDLDEPISFRWLAERIPPEDVVWCFANLPDEHNSLKRHFAVDCAERVKHFMADERSLNVLVVARKYALREASDIELNAAQTAARAAAWDAAQAAARNSAWAAARTAARDSASDAARTAARDSAWAAAWEESQATAITASSDAARTAAREAELQWQVQRIIELTDAGEWSPVGEN